MNARVFVLILGIFVLGSASRALGNETPDGVAETKVKGLREWELSSAEWPVTCEGAVSDTLKRLSSESRVTIRDTPRDKLIRYHHGWGTGIRNRLGLWRGNIALVDSCLARRPNAQRHPDEVSMIIIEAVWEKLQERK